MYSQKVQHMIVHGNKKVDRTSIFSWTEYEYMHLMKEIGK